MFYCGRENLEYQEVHQDVVRFRESGWLRSVYCTGEDFRVAREKETWSALGRGGSRGTGEHGDPVVRVLFSSRQANLFSPYLPGLSLSWIWENASDMIFAIIPALGP